MSRAKRPFPLVADGEPVTTRPRAMQLYDNDDLITNIKGHYTDKIYSDETPEMGGPAQSAQPVINQPVFEPAEKARQEAKADLKRKRQALVTREKPKASLSEPVLKPTAPLVAKKGWGAYADKLRQDSYILAELPQTYQEPKNPSVKGLQKNSYEFLKRSQIYNKEAHQEQKERRVAQELNLSRFEDLN